MKLVKGEKKTIYFIQGHGEKKHRRVWKDRIQQRKSEASKKKLCCENRKPRASEGKVPDDASVIVMPGPTSEPFQNELDLIDGYPQ